MKPRFRVATIGACCWLSLSIGGAVAGCLSAPDDGERVGEAQGALDDCTHDFVFAPSPTSCNDGAASGARVRAGTNKVPATGCEVLDIDTYSSSCEPLLCTQLTTWPAGHEDGRHRAAAELECTRICEADGRACVSLGVAPRSLAGFAPAKVTQCWDGKGSSASCGNSADENPADFVQGSPCALLVGPTCGTAFQRHDVYSCLCRPPEAGATTAQNPIGEPGAGAQAPGYQCRFGAPSEGGPGVLLIALGLFFRRRWRRETTTTLR